MKNLEAEDLPERMRAAVSEAWLIFSRKVGGGLIPVNKEASMQLQYAYILQQLAPLIIFHEDEATRVELEAGVNVDGTNREIDLLFTGQGPGGVHKIAIEMKCYRTKAASGGNRGATDIFMKDLYFDIFLLERYVASGIATQGVSLVMNDMARLVNPKNKSSKCWAYDTSQGAQFGPHTFDTPIGGKAVSFRLERHYQLAWQQYGGFWFLEVEGQSANAI
ncbi:hypothetical protein QQF73_10495 [Marinobacter sp. M216]|uniref:Restriction endonuclease n=1 Tax=Marinobacter albus TaxID=3030833 RepID=A0ABT7HEQ8_9GAMM|nr:hypothetical protein [Marinobacter sp. M216]MDK9558051.1 hypothetical protein [Marinobacter sp. M216]